MPTHTLALIFCGVHDTDFSKTSASGSSAATAFGLSSVTGGCGGGTSPSPPAARAPGAYLARISPSRVWCRSKVAAASPSIFRSPGLAMLGLLRRLLLPAVGPEVEPRSDEVEPRSDGPAASEL